MNLYLIKQDKNNTYDTYDSAVVAAESEEEARHTHPEIDYKTGDIKVWDGSDPVYSTWSSATDVEAEFIGKANIGTKRSVICASFNAG
jgi:hypothetical protein